MSIREREQEPIRPAPPRTQPGSGTGEASRGPLARVRMLLEEIRIEGMKVTWPSPMEARNLTIVVIGISVFVGGLLGVVDLILVALTQFLTGSGG